jgi:beta-galactosidase/beta-glucuronidase
MGIKFHCEYCGKKIEAPDNAGGKWGKCPACHNKLYVPNPDSDEELKLAPIDEKDRAKQKELMAETYKLTRDILLESKIPDEATEAPTSTPEISDKQLTEDIFAYLRQMADGELDQAERTADSIVPHRGRAIKILNRIAISKKPEPELADIPQQVLSGLIKKLHTRIG